MYRARAALALFCACLVIGAPWAVLASAEEIIQEAPVDSTEHNSAVTNKIWPNQTEGARPLGRAGSALLFRNSTCAFESREASIALDSNASGNCPVSSYSAPEKKKKELVPLSQYREEKLLELNIKKAKEKQAQQVVSGPVASQNHTPPNISTHAPSVNNATSNATTVPIATQAPISQGPGESDNSSDSSSPAAASYQANSNTSAKHPDEKQPQRSELEPSRGPKPAQGRNYSRKDRHNYASADCGAKTLAANSEAREISSVLSSSRDRYMLNPCNAQRKWIVIELCEEVGVEELMIANFEYFSSMFRDFQLLGATKYPVSHWYLLGNYTANNMREMQSFEVVNPGPVLWIKYLKIRFFSHYGNEFYCPISEIRVHGLTIVEQMHAQLEIDSEDIESLEQVLHTATAGAVEDNPTPEATTQEPQEQPRQPLDMRPGRVKGQMDPDFNSTIEKYVRGIRQLHNEVTPNPIYSDVDDLIRKSPARHQSSAPRQRPITSQQQQQQQASSGQEAPQPAPPTPPAKLIPGRADSPGEEPQPLIPNSLKVIDASDDGGDDEEEAAADSVGSPSYRPMSSKAMLQVAHLLQRLASRVKSIEVNQSLLAGYLINMTSYFQEELNDATQYHEMQLETKYNTLYKDYLTALNASRQLRVEANAQFEQMKEREARLLRQVKALESVVNDHITESQKYNWSAIVLVGSLVVVLTIMVNLIFLWAAPSPYSNSNSARTATAGSPVSSRKKVKNVPAPATIEKPRPAHPSGAVKHPPAHPSGLATEPPKSSKSRFALPPFALSSAVKKLQFPANSAGVAADSSDDESATTAFADSSDESSSSSTRSSSSVPGGHLPRVPPFQKQQQQQQHSKKHKRNKSIDR